MTSVRSWSLHVRPYLSWVRSKVLTLWIRFLVWPKHLVMLFIACFHLLVFMIGRVVVVKVRLKRHHYLIFLPLIRLILTIWGRQVSLMMLMHRFAVRSFSFSVELLIKILLCRGSLALIYETTRNFIIKAFMSIALILLVRRFWFLLYNFWSRISFSLL